MWWDASWLQWHWVFLKQHKSSYVKHSKGQSQNWSNFKKTKTYPVIGTTTSLRVFSLVTSINSPKPSAACSFVSADPLIKPWSSIEMCQMSSCLKLILCYTFLHSKFKYVYTIINENAQINTCWNIGRKGCSALGRHKPGTRIGTPWK